MYMIYPSNTMSASSGAHGPQDLSIHPSTYLSICLQMGRPLSHIKSMGIIQCQSAKRVPIHSLLVPPPPCPTLHFKHSVITRIAPSSCFVKLMVRRTHSSYQKFHLAFRRCRYQFRAFEMFMTSVRNKIFYVSGLKLQFSTH